VNRRTVRTARNEAQRFLAAADDLLMNGRGYELGESARYVATDGAWSGGSDDPKRSGAVRRASMDLTRALAEMRKP
jgi:hypothetical protein